MQMMVQRLTLRGIKCLVAGVVFTRLSEYDSEPQQTITERQYTRRTFITAEDATEERERECLFTVDSIVDFVTHSNYLKTPAF